MLHVATLDGVLGDFLKKTERRHEVRDGSHRADEAYNSQREDQGGEHDPEILASKNPPDEMAKLDADLSRPHAAPPHIEKLRETLTLRAAKWSSALR